MKIGFLGSGNMARSLGLRLAKSKLSGVDLYFYSPTGTKARQLAVECGGTFVHQLNDFPSDLDYLILAMKPQMLREVSIPKLKDQAIIVSVLAAVSLKTLEDKFKNNRLIRMMPNTPVEIGLGVVAVLVHQSLLSDTNWLVFKNLGPCFGNFIELTSDEELELLTPYTGCLPGVLFSFFDDLTKDLNARNIESLKTKNNERLIMDVVKGIVELYFENKLTLDELRAQVTSKAGLTEHAINSMKKDGIQSLIHSSMNSAINRSKEIQSKLN